MKKSLTALLLFMLLMAVLPLSATAEDDIPLGDPTPLHVCSFTVMIPEDSNESGHVLKCDGCENRMRQSHYYNWHESTDKGDGTHSTTCTVSGCGYVGSAVHNWGTSYTDDGNGGHYLTCGSCGAHSASQAHGNWSYSIKDASQHYVTCGDCGYSSADENHNLGNNTPDGAGGHSQKCSLCPYKTDTAVHVLSNPALISDTQHRRSCSECSYTEDTSHNLSNYTSDAVNHSQTCDICSGTVTKPHSITAASVDDDNHQITCDICQYSDTDEHALGVPTPNSNNTHGASCTVCSYRTADAAHTYGKLTCVAGNPASGHQQTCTACQDVTTLEAHNLSPWKSDNDSTHTRKCSQCDFVETVNHDLGSAEDNGDGRHKQICNDCNDTIFTKHSRKLAKSGTQYNLVCEPCGNSEPHKHTLDTPTCDDANTHTATCTFTGCDYKETKDHVYDGKFTPDDNGHSKVCTVCKGAPKDAAPHKAGDWKSDDNSTHSKFCIDCKHPMDKDDHKLSTPVDIGNGKHRRTCSDCGVKIDSAHSYDSTTGQCACGACLHKHLQYIQNPDGNTHDAVCMVCGVPIVQQERHSFLKENQLRCICGMIKPGSSNRKLDSLPKTGDPLGLILGSSMAVGLAGCVLLDKKKKRY